MAKSIKRQRHIRKILVAGMGPRLGGELYTTLTKWYGSCGPEWTVNRLKALLAVAKQLRAGNREIAREIYRESGIAFRESTLIAKGPFGEVISRIQYAQRPAVLRQLFAVLRVYTCIYLDGVSKTQYDKAIGAITGPAKAVVGKCIPYEWNDKALSTAFRRLNLPTELRLPKPNLSRLKAFSSYHRKVDCSVRAAYGKAVGSLLTCTYLPESLKDLNPCEYFRKELALHGADDSTPGHIAFLQEGGAKARVVAVPNVWCQWMFEPLHHALNRVIRPLESSAVHDQSKGGYYLASHIGKPMWCFDLSSATDRFPRSLQMQVLRTLGCHEYATALEEISSANWEVSPDCKVSYSVGQPMGLYGSFPLFHLSHMVLLEIAANRLGIPPESRPYMVLGDDVIITHPDLAQSYARFMEDIGVDLSPTKSIASSDVGEFAGFLAVRTLKGSAVFRPYKFKSDGFSNPLSLLHSLGGKSRYLGPYWAKLFDIFAKTVKDRSLELSPLVREDREVDKQLRLDSYHLGRLVSEYSFRSQINVPNLSSDTWSKLFQDLLGNQEICTTGSYAAPLRVQAGIGLSLPEWKEEKAPSVDLRINTDPLIRALRYA